MSFKQAVTSGIKWSSVSQFGRQSMQLITTIILARLLSPSDFGLIGMTVVVIGFINLFKDLGTSATVIQQQNYSEELLCSIFWVNVAFGLLAMLVLFIISPIVASFYNEPRLILLLKVLSTTLFISGLSILQQAILERNLAFQILAKVELIAIALGSTVGIFLALLGNGVWSLVYQSLVVALATTILLWLSTKWRPRLSFSWHEIKSVSRYSLNLTGFSIFNYFVANTDYVLVGKFLGAQELGYYSLAYRIMLYPIQSISAVVGRVMFPGFSQIQSDNSKFRYIYLKVVAAIALITFPMMLGLLALVEPFVLTIFGPDWQPTIVLLFILVPVGMVQSIGTTLSVIYQAKGRTDLLFRWGVVMGCVAVIAFAIGLRWGIIGVAAAYAISCTVLLYPNFAIPLKLIELPVWKLCQTLLPTLLSSIVMLAVLLVLNFLLQNLSNSWKLAGLIPTGVSVYLLVTWFVQPQQLKNILDLARKKA